MRHILPLLITTALAACADAAFARGTAKACDPCTWDGDCADGFFCDTVKTFLCKNKSMTQSPGPDCRQECDYCASGGLCTPTPTGEPDGETVCAPASDAECKQADACKKYGLCKRVQESTGGYTCGGVTAEWCEASDRCKEYGQCGVDPAFDQCRPTTNEHCALSTDCALKGLCSLWTKGSNSSCRPASNKDCEAPSACKQEGTCIFCVAPTSEEPSCQSQEWLIESQGSVELVKAYCQMK